MVYEIEIAGEPVPKARPRMTKSGHVYTPIKTKEYEKMVALTWRSKYRSLTLTTAVKMEIQIYCVIPKSLKKGQREKAIAGELKPSKRPDIDNIVKAIMDGLNGVAYEDDKQIVELHAIKKYSVAPCVKVQIKGVTE